MVPAKATSYIYKCQSAIAREYYYFDDNPESDNQNLEQKQKEISTSTWHPFPYLRLIFF